MADREVAGAVNAVAPHPTDPNTVYVGAVNGGVWKTTDPTHCTLVAGLGRFSSLSDRGGSRAGLLRTTDSGGTWAAVDGGGTLTGLNVSGVAPRGTTIVVSANAADNPANAGVWRSTDGGATWVKVSGGAGTGLPTGPAAGLAGDPAVHQRRSERAVPEYQRRG